MRWGPLAPPHYRGELKRRELKEIAQTILSGRAWVPKQEVGLQKPYSSPGHLDGLQVEEKWEMS